MIRLVKDGIIVSKLEFYSNKTLVISDELKFCSNGTLIMIDIVSKLKLVIKALFE